MYNSASCSNRPMPSVVMSSRRTSCTLGPISCNKAWRGRLLSLLYFADNVLQVCLLAGQLLASCSLLFLAHHRRVFLELLTSSSSSFFSRSNSALSAL